MFAKVHVTFKLNVLFPTLSVLVVITVHFAFAVMKQWLAIETHKSKMTQAREESLHGLVARLDIPVSDIAIIDCAFTYILCE